MGVVELKKGLIGKKKVQPDLVLFVFVLLCCTCVFKKLKVCGNSESRKSIGTTFSNRICSFCFSVKHFGNSHNILHFFTVIIFDIVIYNQ